MLETTQPSASESSALRSRFLKDFSGVSIQILAKVVPLAAKVSSSERRALSR